MPFQSEKQRRYLWANEPEIARDWADTYGSRIESNTGGITRLGYAQGDSIRPVDDGPVYRVNEEEVEEENPLEKFMRFMQGNAGNLSQADIDANTKFLQNYGVGGGNISFAQNNPYQMTSGPFQGMNAPGSSAFGSTTPQEMAQKWMKKYGDIDHYSDAMKTKKANISKIAQGNQGNNTGVGYQHPGSKESIATAGDPMAQGGIMRLGYAQGNPHQDQDQGLGMSPGAAQARGLGALHHGSTTSGNLHAGNVGGGNNQGQGPTLDISDVIETFDKGKNALSLIKLFKDQGPMGLLPWGMQKGKQWFDKKYNINPDQSIIYGIGNNQSNLQDTEELEGQLAFTEGSILDKKLKNAFNSYNQTGFGLENVQQLMKLDKQNQEKKGTPLSLPASAYSLIS